MKCPYCGDSFHPQLLEVTIFSATENNLSEHDDHNMLKASLGIRHQLCPRCQRLIVILTHQRGGDRPTSRIVHPKAFSRDPVSPHVPDEIKEDFEEACLVLEAPRQVLPYPGDASKLFCVTRKQETSM
jgi:hypothetical protein